MIHELKIESKYFNDILKGIKKFEIRKNDRNYQVGDYLILKEWNGSNFTKTSIKVVVIYIGVRHASVQKMTIGNSKKI